MTADRFFAQLADFLEWLVNVGLPAAVLVLLGIVGVLFALWLRPWR